MKLSPIADNIVVLPEIREDKTESGIILPDSVEKERPQIGVVVEVGPGRMLASGDRAKMQVEKGDKVLFSKYSPQEIKLEKKEYFILKESDILAVIK